MSKITYLCGIFVGIFLTLGTLYLYSINTYVAFDCDVAKFGPSWQTLYSTYKDIYYSDTGFHCFKGVFLKKEQLGHLDCESTYALRKEYKNSPNLEIDKQMIGCGPPGWTP